MLNRDVRVEFEKKEKYSNNIPQFAYTPRIILKLF